MIFFLWSALKDFQNLKSPLELEAIWEIITNIINSCNSLAISYAAVINLGLYKKGSIKKAESSATKKSAWELCDVVGVEGSSQKIPFYILFLIPLGEKYTRLLKYNAKYYYY